MTSLSGPPSGDRETPVASPAAAPVWPQPVAFFDAAKDNMLSRLTALMLGFYLALHACYMPEFMTAYFGFSFPVVAGTGMLLIAVWAANGSRGRFFQAKISAPFFLMLLWWLASAAIYSYRGYLIELLQYAVRFHAAPIFFCGILVTLGLVRTALTTYALGFVVHLFFTWRYGVTGSTGRFHIPETSMTNPNDLALNLLFGVAFMTIFLVDSNLLKRVFWLCCTLGSLYFVLRTGSRANLLTLLAMLIVACMVSSGRVRTLIVSGSFLIVVLFALLLPRSTWTRLTTFVSASSEELEGAAEADLGGAISSTQARKNLQLRAFKITFLNPIFGVGPRMFTYALDDYMRTQENYNKGSWQHPHNTYLDISSETGLISVSLYIGVIIWCLRTNYRNVRWAQIWPRAPGQALGISISLLLATVAYGFGTLFCSIPYTGQLPFLVALTVANSLSMRDAGLQRYPRPASAPPAPAMFGGPLPGGPGGRFAYGPVR